jgi:glycosyltransferase involved in cell wall biosynthesis
MSNSIIEAGMMGVPALVSRSANAGGVVLDQVTGIVQESSRADDWAASIESLRAAGNTRREYGGAARRRYLETFSLACQVDRLERYYSSLLDNHAQ